MKTIILVWVVVAVSMLLGGYALVNIRGHERSIGDLKQDAENQRAWSLAYEKGRDRECTERVCAVTSDGLWNHECDCGHGATVRWEATDRGQRAVCRCPGSAVK